MEYTGNLYGKVGGMIFKTGKTTEDYDKLEAKVKELQDIVNKTCAIPVVSNSVCPECLFGTVAMFQYLDINNFIIFYSNFYFGIINTTPCSLSSVGPVFYFFCVKRSFRDVEVQCTTGKYKKA